MQFPVKVEPFYATMASVSGPVRTAVMEFKTALMAVMRLGVLTVSRSDTWGDAHHGSMVIVDDDVCVWLISL